MGFPDHIWESTREDMFRHPHRRLNPLNGNWILVSPHRTLRPWQGRLEITPHPDRPAHDPECYLCPGNRRASGEMNPNYDSTFVFTNDFSALLPDTPDIQMCAHPLFRAEAQKGACRVVCFSPRHDLTLAEMPCADIRRVVDVWAEQILELGRQYQWVQVFENKGVMMGCSNPHPHGQIWAGTSLPIEPAREDRRQREYMVEHRSALLIDYIEAEEKYQERIITANSRWVALVPFWASWPFEALLVPRRHVTRLPDLNDEERNLLSEILKNLLTRFDNLFEVSFPYSMGWHGAPRAGGDDVHWQLHAHFYPPLLRSAEIKKFMVGYEMMAEAQRDLTPEQSARRLRELSVVRNLATRNKKSL